MAHRARWWIRSAAALVCAAGVLAGPRAAGAEDAPALPGAPVVPEKLTQAQLKELVGPVAMYPDGVLAALLPATTFPLDVVAAARWLEEKKGVVDQVPEDRGWDASVVALLQFPDVVVWLNENLSWMDQMGRAVTLQQAEVLQAIQDFRREAKAAGNLPAPDKLVVREEEAPGAPSGTTIIVVEPASPQIVYVPTYDPYRVCCGPSLGYSAYTFGLGFAFGAVGYWGWHDIYWGWWNWPRNYGWYGGIYYHHDPFYWGHSRSYGSYAGPYRPRRWTSSYYPPGGYGYRSTAIARPTATRRAFASGTTGTGQSYVRPPSVTRFDAGSRPPPSPVTTTRSTPTLRRTTGTRLPGAGATVPTTGARLPSTRGTWTGRVTTPPSTGTTPVLDTSAARGRQSLQRTYRAPSSSIGTTPRSTGQSVRTFRAPSTRTSPSISSQPRSSPRPSVGQTRTWSSRGHGSLQGSSVRDASGRTFRR